MLLIACNHTAFCVFLYRRGSMDVRLNQTTKSTTAVSDPVEKKMELKLNPFYLLPGGVYYHKRHIHT